LMKFAEQGHLPKHALVDLLSIEQRQPYLTWKPARRLNGSTPRRARRKTIHAWSPDVPLRVRMRSAFSRF
jgi:hypothetical protein